MNIIFASLLNSDYKDETGVRHAIKIEDKNEILTNIKKYVNSHDNLVVVANNKFDYQDNDNRLDVVYQSFEMSGLKFKNKTLIDERNKSKSKEIIENADLIILCGGKCLCQLEFFEEINLKQSLKNSKALIIGISAGAMNLCETVANFPEETIDLSEPRWLDGLGFSDKIIIPHFDGERVEYQFPSGEIEIVSGYILPMSVGKEFLTIDNDSYILKIGETQQAFGKAYVLRDRKVQKCIKNKSIISK